MTNLLTALAVVMPSGPSSTTTTIAFTLSEAQEYAEMLLALVQRARGVAG